MQMASSARSRYGASRSASLKTATDLDAQVPAGADDPQGDLAAVGDQDALKHRASVVRIAERSRSREQLELRTCTAHCSGRGIDPEQHLAVLDRLLVLDQDLGDDAGAVGRDLVEDLHRLDQADDRGRA